MPRTLCILDMPRVDQVLSLLLLARMPDTMILVFAGYRWKLHRHGEEQLLGIRGRSCLHKSHWRYCRRINISSLAVCAGCISETLEEVLAASHSHFIKNDHGINRVFRSTLMPLSTSRTTPRPRLMVHTSISKASH